MHSPSKFLYFSISQLSALSFALLAFLTLSASPVSAQMKIGSNPTSITAATNLEIEGTGSVKTVFLQNGNVGIGTTTPGVILELNTTSQSDGSWLKINSGTTRYKGLRLTTGNTLRWDVAVSNNAETGSSAGSDFIINRFDDAGSYLSTPFYITRSTGNVGIGTTSPSHTLQVNGNIITAPSTAGAWSSVIGIARDPANITSNSAYIQLSNVNDMYFVNKHATGGYLFATNTVTALKIDSSGNVGIGTTSPGSLLHINNPSTSNTATTQLFIQQSGISNINAALRVTAQSSGDLFRTSIVNNGTEHLTVLSGGNVGIGTTSPNASSKLTLAAMDGALEGAQMTWNGAGSNDAWTQDVYSQNHRLFTNTANTNQLQIFNNGAGEAGLYVEGNVGIGITAPAAKLDVVGAAGLSGIKTTVTGGGYGLLSYANGASVAVYGNQASATGHAGLFHNTNSNYYCYIGYLNTYSIVCNGPTSLPSDMRLKKDITSLTDTGGLTAIMNLRPISYVWKDTKKGNRIEYGFVAQEVEKVFPNLVGSIAPTTDEEKAQTGGAPMKTLQYEGFIAPLVKSVQELNTKTDTSVAGLQTQIDHLAGENNELRARVTKLESLLTNK